MSTEEINKSELMTLSSSTFRSSDYCNGKGNTEFMQNWLVVTERILASKGAGDGLADRESIIWAKLQTLQNQIIVTQRSLSRRKKMGQGPSYGTNFEPDFSISSDPFWTDVASAADKDPIANAQKRNKWMAQEKTPMTLPTLTLQMASEDHFEDYKEGSTYPAEWICDTSKWIISRLCDRRDQISLYVQDKQTFLHRPGKFELLRAISGPAEDDNKSWSDSWTTPGTPKTTTGTMALTPQTTGAGVPVPTWKALYSLVSDDQAIAFVSDLTEFRKIRHTNAELMAQALEASRFAVQITESWTDVLGAQ